MFYRDGIVAILLVSALGVCVCLNRPNAEHRVQLIREKRL